MIKDPGFNFESGVFCDSDEPKSEFARDLGDRLQSRNVPFGTSGDYLLWNVLSELTEYNLYFKQYKEIKK